MIADPFKWRDFAFGFSRLFLLLFKSDIAQSLVNLYLGPPKQEFDWTCFRCEFWRFSFALILHFLCGTETIAMILGTCGGFCVTRRH